MKKPKLSRILFVIGVIALITGAIDPLEGSVIILFGGTLVTFVTYFTHDHQWKLFLIFDILIALGIFFLFYFSSLGGFGKNAMSWWWFITVIPYPLGWFAMISLLIARTIKRVKK